VEINLDKFVSKNEDQAKKVAEGTIGLVKLDDFQKIVKESTGEGAASKAAKEPTPEVIEKQKQKIKARTSRLSFNDDSEEEEPEDDDTNPLKRVKIRVDPSALLQGQMEAKSFEEAQRIREEAEKAKALAEEEFVKNQPVKLSCSFWDGADHRFVVEIKKGDSVQEILEKAQLAFPPLKGSLISNLVLVKENIMLPLDLTIYECLRRKATVRQKRPLFEFTQDEHKVEVDSSKNCKIVSRSWLERNKHVYPAKQWIQFDPAKIFPIQTFNTQF
jgi:protein FAM50